MVIGAAALEIATWFPSHHMSIKASVAVGKDIKLEK